MNKPLNPHNPEPEMVALIKNTFGDGDIYGVKAWASPRDRDEGYSDIIKTDVSFEDAMTIFAAEIEVNSSIELNVDYNGEEIALCIGGTDWDVHDTEWLDFEKSI